MTESIAPPDTGVFGDHERPKRIFKIIVIGDSHVGRRLKRIQKPHSHLSFVLLRKNLSDLSILFRQISRKE